MARNSDCSISFTINGCSIALVHCLATSNNTHVLMPVIRTAHCESGTGGPRGVVSGEAGETLDAGLGEAAGADAGAAGGTSAASPGWPPLLNRQRALVLGRGVASTSAGASAAVALNGTSAMLLSGVSATISAAAGRASFAGDRTCQGAIGLHSRWQ